MGLKSMRRWTLISLVLVYLVILAGSVVRMTGSGMGCPDWPKCFGYYIPPTDAEQITWKSGASYEAGKMVIHNESLWTAKQNLVAGETFNPERWEAYTKHDYAHFNVYHTYTEYINRLMGALSGLAVLILLVVALRVRPFRKDLFLLALLQVFLLGFQAWLGAKVVDSNLAPVKITVHMLAAFAIVALLLFTLDKAREGTRKPVPKGMLLWGGILMLLLLVQVVLGTQVREGIDEIAKHTGYENRTGWIEQLGTRFIVHRSFSIALVVVLVVFIRNIAKSSGFNKQVKALIGVFVLEILSGVVMAYFEVPATMQPLHMLMSSIAFGLLFSVLLGMKRS